MSGSNIKGAPAAFTPDLVADFVAWLDRSVAERVVIGVDLSSEADRHVVATWDGGRIVSIEERHG